LFLRNLCPQPIDFRSAKISLFGMVNHGVNRQQRSYKMRETITENERHVMTM
jgi:hypothetical protein